MEQGPARFAVGAATLEGAAVLTVRGDLDVVTAPALTDAIAAVDPSIKRVVVDMSLVDGLDSTGVHALFRAHTRLTIAGRELVVQAPAPAIRQLLEVTGVARFVPILEGPGPAMAGPGPQPSEGPGAGP
ncbi:MAG: STAS domain-containing protein [Acidimicrobiales bacterium]